MKLSGFRITLIGLAAMLALVGLLPPSAPEKAQAEEPPSVSMEITQQGYVAAEHPRRSGVLSSLLGIVSFPPFTPPQPPTRINLILLFTDVLSFLHRALESEGGTLQGRSTPALPLLRIA